MSPRLARGYFGHPKAGALATARNGAHLEAHVYDINFMWSRFDAWVAQWSDKRQGGSLIK